MTNSLLVALVASGQNSSSRDLSWAEVGPGLAGFLTMFFLAAATIGLMYAMTRQMRRLNHAIRQEEQKAAESRAAAASAGDPAS